MVNAFCFPGSRNQLSGEEKLNQKAGNAGIGESRKGISKMEGKAARVATEFQRDFRDRRQNREGSEERSGNRASFKGISVTKN